MKVLGIIPARFGSTRLEGKPLLDIHGKSMVRRVYEQALKAKHIEHVIIATDAEIIARECRQNNLNYIMTSTKHTNGTERCAEALENLENHYDLVINIQGDEPFIHPESIDQVIQIFLKKPHAQIGTLIKKIDDASYLTNPSIIKVVKNRDEKALYFSRNSIPYMRDTNIENWLEKETYYKHIGLYAYKADVLKRLVSLEESKLERVEKLEQLRWLENGFEIYLEETEFESKSIDTIEDYHYILQNITKYINE